ncbi:WD40 repeat domain-containing protein [Lentzea sp. HUAS TT2]|uniref:WD40 repeat domain-containing protein n=1 Tax=Lentzea sp. HUAS TT2 TaxID=3447454 RepID=UPI003F72C5DD
MGVLRRAATPPGPISDLFDRLHELHLRAGEPGLRQIAADLGIGVVSHATVHNVFRGPRVPKWGYLDLIVEVLGGDSAEFHALWLAARQVERRLSSSTAAVAAGVASGSAGTPWNCTEVLSGHGCEVTGVAFSPSGRLLATVSADMTIRLWDARTGTSEGDPLIGHHGPIWGVAYSPTGRMLATASVDTTVRLWDPVTGQIASIPPLEHDGYVVGVAFCLNGRALVTGGGDGFVRVWDLTDNGALVAVLHGHAAAINDLAVNPRGVIASASVDGDIRLWDAATGEPVSTSFAGHTSSVACVAFSPDGLLLATGADDGTVRVWITATGTCVYEAPTGHDGPIWGVAFATPETLATASRDHTARLWDVTSGAPLGPPLTGHGDALTHLAVSQRGNVLATASDDGTARLWQPSTEPS